MPVQPPVKFTQYEIQCLKTTRISVSGGDVALWCRAVPVATPRGDEGSEMPVVWKGDWV